MRILCMGDAVGDGGVEYLRRGRLLSRLRRENEADLVIVNGENSAAGNGISRDSAEALFDAGADVITGGNHTFRRRDVAEYLDDAPYVLRPANYPDAAPGHGFCVIDCAGVRVLVVNLIGCVFMESQDSPFTVADRILAQMQGKYDLSVFDIHAEATSEKMALAAYLDGRASAVFGTHTHVATADAQILPRGTGYITDLGMCGSHAGILGVSTDVILRKYLVRTPVTFTPAVGREEAHGVLFAFSRDGRCVECRPVHA